MFFLNITDPKKRDSIVDNYLPNVKSLQHRDIIERAQDLARQDVLNQMIEPVVKSTGKSTQAMRGTSSDSRGNENAERTSRG